MVRLKISKIGVDRSTFRHVDPVDPDLLTCPFCDKKPVLEYDYDRYTVGCYSALCAVMPVLAMSYKKKYDAILSWNRRAEESQK